MGGSLILGSYDLLDNTSVARLVSNPGMPTLSVSQYANRSGFGAGTPDVSTVARLLTDGDIQSGVRTGNRQITLFVGLFTHDRATLAQVQQDIYRTVDQAAWTLTWTPNASSPSVVFECQRGTVSRGWNLTVEAGGFAVLALSIPAAPFTRAVNPTTLVPPVSAVGEVTIDALDDDTGIDGALAYSWTTEYPTSQADVFDFATIMSADAATMATDSDRTTDGQSASVKQTTTPVGVSFETYSGYGQYAHWYSYFLYYRWKATLADPVDLSAISSVGLYAATDCTQAGDGTSGPRSLTDWAGASDVGTANSGDWRLTLYSSDDDHSTWLVNKAIGTGGTPGVSPWQRILLPLDGTPESTAGSLDLTAVTGYRLELWLSTSAGLTSASVWVQSLVGVPANGGALLAGAYGVVNFPAVLGAGRTPVSLAVEAKGSTAARRLLLARTPNPQPGYAPILDAPNAATGTQTTDTHALSGKHVVTGATWTRPAHSFNGEYAVLAWIAGSGGTHTVSFTAEITGDSAVSSVASRTFSGSTTSDPSGELDLYNVCVLGTLTLPPRAVAGPNSAATITFTITDDTNVSFPYRYDLIVLVDLSGECVFIDCPSGSGFSNWFLDEPSVTQQVGQIFAGSESDRSDALAVPLTYLRSAEVVNNFDPGANMMTAVIDNAATDGATVQVSYFQRSVGEQA